MRPLAGCTAYSVSVAEVSLWPEAWQTEAHMGLQLQWVSQTDSDLNAVRQSYWH